MQTERNPRDVITPSAFAVAPELLGLALARPWRRAAAILLDLALCGLIVAIWQARSVFFSALAAFLVYRITSRARPGAGCLMRVLGVSLRGTLALATFVICLASLSAIQFEPRGNNVSMDPATGAAAIEMPALSAGLTLAETASLLRATTPEEAEAIAARVRDRLAAKGLSAPEARLIGDALAKANDDGARLNPVAIEALRRAFAALDTLPPAPDTTPDVDSLALAYGAALAANDTIAAAAIRTALAEALTAERVGDLERDNRMLRSEIEILRQRTRDLEDARRGRGITTLLRAAITEDLGLGFGWLALYFTAFTVAWRGYTPGKRLLGIRVIRLDGKPLTTWQCFERFGGYSASLATGLLGFAQILWDRNRQALHDKIVSTVVVQERPVRRSAADSTAEQATGGDQSAADSALYGGSHQVVTGKGETRGKPAGVEGGEMSQVAGVELDARVRKAVDPGPSDPSTDLREHGLDRR